MCVFLCMDVLCWLSFNAFNECFDVNYDKYANEQCCVSQLLDNNSTRQSRSNDSIGAWDPACFLTLAGTN